MDLILLYVLLIASFNKHLLMLFLYSCQAFSSQEKQQLTKVVIDVSPSGKLPKGKTEIPFQFPLEMKEGINYFETYHGILVNVRYTLTCDIPRGVFSKNLKKTIEVIIVDYVCNVFFIFFNHHLL